MAQLESSGGREKGMRFSLRIFSSLLRTFVANQFWESDITLVKNTNNYKKNTCVFAIIYLRTQVVFLGNVVVVEIHDPRRRRKNNFL